jgi:hypothetical protein
MLFGLGSDVWGRAIRGDVLSEAEIRGEEPPLANLSKPLRGPIAPGIA